MLECGPGVLAGMKKAGVATDLPDSILISHLHGDHFGGVPFLFLEYLFENPRERPLVIAGPPTTRERIDTVYAGLYREAHLRKLDFEVSYLEIRPGEGFELPGFSGEAFEVPHGAHPFALAYRLTADDGSSVLFSGDSAWTEDFVTHSEGADLFLCECCFLDRQSGFHVNYRELMANRDRLGCARLLLTHVGAEVRGAEALELELATDGMVIEVGSR